MHPFDAMTEPELRALMTRLADRITSELPADTSFILLAAPFGAGGIAQYVSNCRKGDAAKWMLETIDRWATNDYVPR